MRSFSKFLAISLLIVACLTIPVFADGPGWPDEPEISFTTPIYANGSIVLNLNNN